MHRQLVLVLVLFLGSFVIVSASKLSKRNILELSKDRRVSGNINLSNTLKPLSGLLCPVVGGIPLVGPLLNCSTSAGAQNPLNLPGGLSGLLNLTNLLSPGGSLCTALTSIPTIGPVLAGILCKSSGGITLPPIVLPTSPSGGVGSLSSLNFIACPVLSGINSVPALGPVFVNSVNPIFFRCAIPTSAPIGVPNAIKVPDLPSTSGLNSISQLFCMASNFFGGIPVISSIVPILNIFGNGCPTVLG